jgi:hypothetical protein
VKIIIKLIEMTKFFYSTNYLNSRLIAKYPVKDLANVICVSLSRHWWAFFMDNIYMGLSEKGLDIVKIASMSV